MPISVLNVAEKPSVAKEVSRVLSNGQAQFQHTCAPYNGVWRFPYNINGTACEMVFTSVAGHLMEVAFAPQYKGWHSCQPIDLYNAPVHKQVPEDKQLIQQNLEELSRGCQWLILWLDCDREGENIAFEVIQVCTQANARLEIKRAHFSSLGPQTLRTALATLGPPNENESKAVDARQEIDLRIGASFTRLQTLLLQDKFDWQDARLEAEGARKLISYGPCQFPTLGLIVQRAWDIYAHIAEPFWFIHVMYRDGQKTCDFKWQRGHLFDHTAAMVLYELCVENPQARVTSIEGNEVYKAPPFPLSTLALQKEGTKPSVLRLSGERIMKLAEELYQAGFISYPRTETDSFPPDMDLRALIADQVNHPEWGHYAHRLLNEGLYHPPGDGGHDDKAHPPIHPTKFSAGEHDWCPDKKRLYDFIVRSFLAACSKQAVGRQTIVNVDIACEAFSARGLMVTQRNWLDVYPYTTWGSTSSLPLFTQGQTFIPHELLLKEGVTKPPEKLSEGDLLGAMDRHGIGTDATVADHIKKQLDRGYAVKDNNARFSPTPLGEALISAYRKMDLANLWQPNLRGQIERNIKLVAQGRRSKEEVLEEAVHHFKQDMAKAVSQAGVMEAEVGQYFQRAQPRNGLGNLAGMAEGVPVGPCRVCGGELKLCPAAEPNRGPSVVCSAAAVCRTNIMLPTHTQADVTELFCQDCRHGPVRKVALRFRPSRVPVGTDPLMTACILCDPTLQGILDVTRTAHGPGGRGARGAGAGRANPAARGHGARGLGHGRAAGPAGQGRARNMGQQGRGPAAGAPPRGANPPGQGRGANAAGQGRGNNGAAGRGRDAGGQGRGRNPRGTQAPRRGGRGSGSGGSITGAKRPREPTATQQRQTAAPGARGRQAGGRAARGGRGGPQDGQAGRSRGRGAPSNQQQPGFQGPAFLQGPHQQNVPRFATAAGEVHGVCTRCNQPGHWARGCPY